MPSSSSTRSDSRLPAVLAVREPAHPALRQQLRAGLGLELAPQRPRPPRHRRVVGVGAVRAADQPRLAAGRRPRVAGLELVDEHDLVAAPRQPPRQRRPERPRPDDHDALHASRRYNPSVLVAAALATLVLGHSVQGREIRATRVGEEDAPVNVLVVGDVHGNEPAGEAIVAALRKRARRRRRVLARADRQPGRPRDGHAPERARRGPQPQLPVALADRARAARTTPARRRARSPRRRR